MRRQFGLFRPSLFALTAVVCACGGTPKKNTVSTPPADEEQEEDSGEALIPEEKFEEINRTFERKATTVARCFPEAVDAGEVDKNERIKLTVGLTIQPDGTATNIEVLETTKASQTIEECLRRTIERWEFSSLPRPLKYSYGFVLQRY